MRTLDIILVNWNAGVLLWDALASIVAAHRNEFQLQRVVVVDNASTDGSLDGLKDLPLPLIILRNNMNRGFAAACNQGAAGSRADLLLFLNPDVRLLDDTLARAVAFMEKEQPGVLGVQLLDEGGRVQRSCARFPTPSGLLAATLGLDRLAPHRFPPHFMTEWDHGETRVVDQVMGAFFLTPRSLFEALGGFDERFFVYFEEVDYARRARRVGRPTVYLAEAQAYHKGAGTTDQVRACRLFYFLRSRLHYGFKHFGPLGGAAHAAATLTVEPLARLLWAARRRSAPELTEIVAAYVLLLRDLPALLSATSGERA